MGLINCPECGEKLPSDSTFCVKCGAKVLSESFNNEGTTKELSFLKRNKKKIRIGGCCLLGILIVFFIINSIQADNLKRELMRDWSSVEGDDGSYILCILDFSENEIDYKLETGYAWMDMTVTTYDYKVISGNKIKVNMYGDDWEIVTVEFNEERTMMTVSPALTSVDEEEEWFNFD